MAEEGIEIEALPTTVNPTVGHSIPAQKDGLTVRLTVSQIIALITDSAPETLDTLNELAAALGDDPNFATTVTTALAGKLSANGGTLTGNLNANGYRILSLEAINGGPLGALRNKLINPSFRINQRGGTKTPGVGNYGFDRWKGHASGLEQVVESLPAGNYTLIFDGGGTGSVGGATAQQSPYVFNVPLTGNTSVVVPSTVNNVALIEGDAREESFPFDQRPISLEWLLCFRYYIGTIPMGGSGYVTATGQSGRAMMNTLFPVPMRTTPTISYSVTASSNVSANPLSGVSTLTQFGILCSPVTNGTASNFAYWDGTLTANAEFP